MYTSIPCYREKTLTVYYSCIPQTSSDSSPKTKYMLLQDTQRDHIVLTYVEAENKN